MRLDELRPPKGANKRAKRVGRGSGSGHGKTSCRGHKGQRARSGSKMRPGFEGGQMPLARRVPKRGFVNPFKRPFQIINIESLNRFKKDSSVNPEMLKQQGMIKNPALPVKVLGRGKINKPIIIQAQAASQGARQKIEAAGGKIEILKKNAAGSS